jgi:hypothetical protein
MEGGCSSNRHKAQLSRLLGHVGVRWQFSQGITNNDITALEHSQECCTKLNPSADISLMKHHQIKEDDDGLVKKEHPPSAVNDGHHRTYPI